MEPYTAGVVATGTGLVTVQGHTGELIVKVVA